MNIAIIGIGYVGLVTAVCFAEKGHNVICVDLQEEKIEQLKKGKSPIFEPMLEELMIKNKNRLAYTVNNKDVYKNIDVIFICVGTPEKQDGSANLKYIYEVADNIANNIKRDTTVVIKSTVPVGTGKKIEEFINSNLKSDVNIEVVSNPEFLAQGTAVNDTLNSQRIILGVESQKAREIMKEIYNDFKQPLVITDRQSAEMIKYASNDFLALKISYINEIANLCEIVGANIEDVTRGMGLDERIGNKFLQPGVGYGGSCFPKDTKALHWMATVNDYELKTIKATIEVNEKQKMKLLEKAKKYYKSFKDLKIAILGVTFKANTDDLREAPSLNNISVLYQEGAKITVFDPIGKEKLKNIYKDKIIYADTIEQALIDADLCLIFTDWYFVKNIDLNLFKKFMKHPIVIDGRNCYNLNDIPHDMIYESIGRKTKNKKERI